MNLYNLLLKLLDGWENPLCCTNQRQSEAKMRRQLVSFTSWWWLGGPWRPELDPQSLLYSYTFWSYLNLTFLSSSRMQIFACCESFHTPGVSSVGVPVIQIYALSDEERALCFISFPHMAETESKGGHSAAYWVINDSGCFRMLGPTASTSCADKSQHGLRGSR